MLGAVDVFPLANGPEMHGGSGHFYRVPRESHAGSLEVGVAQAGTYGHHGVRQLQKLACHRGRGFL